MRFGVNTWVWVSPLTDKELEWLVPHIAELGFDWIELPLEQTDTTRLSEGRPAHQETQPGCQRLRGDIRRPRFHPPRSERPAECNCICEALHRCCCRAGRHQSGRTLLQRGWADLAANPRRA